MAIVKLGPVVTGIRGSLGGVVFSNSRGGPYCRSSYKPVNPRTALQSDCRNFISWVPGLWRGLTVEQQEAWATYAALPAQALTNSLGETYYASGYNWFLSINSNRTEVGLVILEDPPVSGTPEIPAVIEVTLEFIEGVLLSDCTFEEEAPIWDQYLIVHAAYVPSGGRLVQHSGFYWIFGALMEVPVNPDFGPAIQARWPLCTAGDQVFLRMFAQSLEGRRSAPYACGRVLFNAIG